VAVLDEKNFFVRYRQILRPEMQTKLLFLIFIYVAIPMVVVSSVFHELTLQPCTTASTRDNGLVLTTIVAAWCFYFPPNTFLSIWSSRRLRKFPHDHWQMGAESSYSSTYAIFAAIACLLVLVFVPTFDGILFVLLTAGIVLQLLHFLMPYLLHRKTLQQLASSDLSKLSSLDRLLESPEFLVDFHAFLQKEFSSENLYFWQEVHKLQLKYKAFLPPDMGLVDSRASMTLFNDTGMEALTQAVEDCRRVGHQFIGDRAITQVNISGETGQDIESSMRRANELLARGVQESELRVLVEQQLKELVVAQREIYEGLKKDSYARFLLTPAAQDLNKNENFKRLLAAEKLEGEVRTTTTASTESKNSSGSGQKDGSNNSNKRTSEVTVGRSPAGTLGGVSTPTSKKGSISIS